MTDLPAHDAPAAGTPAPAAPLTATDEGRRRSAAEEARTLLLAGAPAATLATLSEDGTPWASLVSAGALPDGSPVLCVSTMAEHGRNLGRDPRCSLLVVDPGHHDDPLAVGRATLACRARRPVGDEASAHPEAERYAAFRDFSTWVLDVQRVRWVGGYGRMASVTTEAFAAAEPDPVGPQAAFAVRHLNEDHADALLLIARHLAGFPDATSARCRAADRYGIDLELATPRGPAWPRVPFAEAATDPGGLRPATVELTGRARAAAAA